MARLVSLTTYPGGIASGYAVNEISRVEEVAATEAVPASNTRNFSIAAQPATPVRSRVTFKNGVVREYEETYSDIITEANA